MIRTAAIDDLAGIARAHTASIQVLCASFYSADQIEAWTTPLVPAIYASALEDETVVVADVGGEIAGFGILDPARGEVHAVYVHPAYAGLGVGSALLARMESIARKNGVDRLSCHRLACSVELPCVEMQKHLPANIDFSG